MNLKKSLVTTVLAGAIAMSLTGCGDSQEKITKDKNILMMECPKVMISASHSTPECRKRLADITERYKNL